MWTNSIQRPADQIISARKYFISRTFSDAELLAVTDRGIFGLVRRELKCIRCKLDIKLFIKLS